MLKSLLRLWLAVFLIVLMASNGTFAKAKEIAGPGASCGLGPEP